MGKQKVSVSLDGDVWRRFQAVCKLKRTYPSAVLEEHMQRWLKQHEAEAMASLAPQPVTPAEAKRSRKGKG
jgi:hypothetical protein